MTRIIYEKAFNKYEYYKEARLCQEHKMGFLKIMNRLDNIIIDLELSKNIENAGFINDITVQLQNINIKLKEA